MKAIEIASTSITSYSFAAMAHFPLMPLHKDTRTNSQHPSTIAVKITAQSRWFNYSSNRYSSVLKLKTRHWNCPVTEINSLYCSTLNSTERRAGLSVNSAIKLREILLTLILSFSLPGSMSEQSHPIISYFTPKDTVELLPWQQYMGWNFCTRENLLGVRNQGKNVPGSYSIPKLKGQ